MQKKNFPPAFDNPDFMHSREARSLRIISEYLEPEMRLNEYGIEHTVVFFGSARIRPDKKTSPHTWHYYQEAENFAFALANLSKEIESIAGSPFYICTGGGPGIMEAANQGAARAGSMNLGLNIELPHEQGSNKYVTPELSIQFHYFFMRKLWFMYQAKAIIVFPGGFGTMDELFEMLTMIQTRKLDKLDIPVLLYDRGFWEDLINFQKFVDYGLISPRDLDLFHYFSDIDEGIDYLRPRLIEKIKNIDQYLEMKFPI